MSVSTRKLIELSFLALLDSGINYRGQQVGCYASGIPFDILTVADPVRLLGAFHRNTAHIQVPCTLRTNTKLVGLLLADLA